ncbi:hypothetical protein AD938_01800 [Gluconobacter japonicus]|nr:hypothetical protein AD938_01800 [Gluconobacter japonicus]
MCLGHVGKRSNPEPCCGDIEETHEGRGGLVVADRNAAHLLEVVEDPLDAVAVPVTLSVCFLWNTAAFL